MSSLFINKLLFYFIFSIPLQWTIRPCFIYKLMFYEKIKITDVCIREVHPGSHPGQHVEAVGLQQGEVSQDLHRAQEREVLHLRKLQRHRFNMLQSDRNSLQIDYT